MQLDRRLALVLGPLMALVVGTLTQLAGLPYPAVATAAVTALCATWWVTEPIPIPATSLIPFAAFPMLGVLTHSQVATAYGHTLILLLLGGFILSTAMARSGAHRRLAFLMLQLVGTRGRKQVVLGFMLAAGLLSMWISNTATTLMLLPVALAVLEQDEGDALQVPLLLGLAYGASIGGLGTPVGTPPNVIFMSIYQEQTQTVVGFAQWMKVGVPAVLLLLPVAWLWLTRGLARGNAFTLPMLGAWRPAEKRVLWVFTLTALAWVTRSEPFGGWSGLLGIEGAGDSTVALLAVIAMFLIPDGEDGQLLDWKTANTIPWGLLILFGGGIAIARAFGASGLSEALGEALSGLAGWPVIGMTLALCLVVTFLTEVTSNTATTTLLMPILAAAGIGAAINPALFMVPAALSASCAFMLPVATAPNAIVFGTDKVTVKRMAREGFGLNLAGAALITLVVVLLVPRVFG